jgi:hypothetical protein
MGVQAYTFVIVCMGALSATAAIGALALALGQLAPRRKPAHNRSGRRPMMFEAPAAKAQPAAVPFDPEPAPAAVTDEPRPFDPAPQFQTRPQIQPQPQPQPKGRLELALMSRRAPGRLRVPVDLARGRILELNLPLLLANAGETGLDDVSIHITLPNEVTYGASLERLGREGLAGLPGAAVRYTLTENETRIRIDAPHLAAGAEARVPVPVSIKHAADCAYPILATVSATGLETVERRYELELLDPTAVMAAVSTQAAWVCRPDETSRQRDPHLPLDRIASTQFAIAEPAMASAPTMAQAALMSPAPAYEPLRL